MILYNFQENNRQVILRKVDLGDIVWVPLSNSSKEMIVSSAESCCGVHNTSNAWALAVVEIRPSWSVMCGITLWMPTGSVGRLVLVCSTYVSYMKTTGLPLPCLVPAEAREVPPVRPVIDELSLAALLVTDTDCRICCQMHSLLASLKSL